MNTDLQKQLLAEAKKQLEHKPWFRGIHVDHLPTDDEIKELSMDKAVQFIVQETCRWDSTEPFPASGSDQEIVPISAAKPDNWQWGKNCRLLGMSEERTRRMLDASGYVMNVAESDKFWEGYHRG